MSPRVVIVINGLGTGGAERSTAEMLPRLVDAGVEPIVVCFYHRPEGVEDAVLASGFDVRFLDEDRLVPRVRALRRILASERPDVLHTTHFEGDLVGRLASIGSGTPVVSSLVNTSYDAVRLQDPRIRRWKLRLTQTIDGWTARHLTDRFHAITGTVKQAAVDALGIAPEHVTVVERGRDPARLGEPSASRRRQARQQMGLAPDDEVVLNVARQEFQKGQAYLLDAATELLERRPRLRILIAGRLGNASPDLERRREELGLDDRVRFLGHRDDVPELLAAADMFVFPSLYEGLGGAVIEAMAMGVPVVASDLPALREVLEDGRGGVLVPAGSPTAIAAAVDRLLDDRDEAESLGRGGRQIFETRFTIDRSAAGMVALYTDVAAERGGRR